MAGIGIVCGMASEVRTLGRWTERPEVIVGVSGARPDKAEEIAGRMIDETGVRLLVSWGIAGGLDPALLPGQLVIPSEVVTAEGARLPLAAKLLGIEDGKVVLGEDQVIASVTAKDALRARSCAIAVDMETHRVARAAQGRVPCLAVRAISDPADRSLPSLALSALSEDGRPLVGRVLLGLARRPWELPLLVQAGRDSARALAVLRRRADDVFRQLLASADP